MRCCGAHHLPVLLLTLVSLFLPRQDLALSASNGGTLPRSRHSACDSSSRETGAGIPGTKVGPLGHPETMDKGLDTLRKRAADAYAAGARFAKWRNGASPRRDSSLRRRRHCPWLPSYPPSLSPPLDSTRAVLQIDPKNGLPSPVSVREATDQLAKYALICQAEGLVPIVEPEIVPNGDHDIYACAGASVLPPAVDVCRRAAGARSRPSVPSRAASQRQRSACWRRSSRPWRTTRCTLRAPCSSPTWSRAASTRSRPPLRR